MVKQVFSTNDMVAHTWGQQTQDAGRSPTPQGGGRFGSGDSADESRVSFKGPIYYSYREPVARILDTDKGGRAVIYTAGRAVGSDAFGTTYGAWSPSTTGHTSAAVGSIRHLAPESFKVPHVGGWTWGTPGNWSGAMVAVDHVGNAQYLAAEYHRHVEAATRKRGALGRDYIPGRTWEPGESYESQLYSEGESLERRLLALWASANDYLDSFMAQDQNATILLKGLPIDAAGVRDVAADIMAQREARAARALAKLTPKELARRAAAKVARAAQAERVRALRYAGDAERLEGWRDGLRIDSYRLPRAADGSAYVRATGVKRDKAGNVTGGTLETSQGARVPLCDAIRVFRFLNCVRESGHAWQPTGLRTLGVGAFRVSSVDPTGDFVAGCHRFTWGEVIALATRLGLEGLGCDDLGRRILGAE